MIGEALFSLLFDLRPNCGGRNENNGNFLQKAPCRQGCTQCPRTSSRPLLTHASTRDSWTLVGKSWSISCGITAPSPGSSCAQAFVCALQESVSAVLCKFWRLYGGVNGDLLQEDLCPENSNCLIKVAFLRKVETTIRLNPGGIMGFGTSGITRGLWFFSLTYITISL